MTNIDTASRVEPMLDKLSGSSSSSHAQSASSAASNPQPAAALTVVSAQTPSSPDAPGFSQLARIEEKAARIEEKFARTESLMQRVETSASNLGDLARKSEVDALSERVNRLPGFKALMVTSLVTSVVTALFVVILFKYILR
jgi:hypothetical protein